MVRSKFAHQIVHWSYHKMFIKPIFLNCLTHHVYHKMFIKPFVFKGGGRLVGHIKA